MELSKTNSSVSGHSERAGAVSFNQSFASLSLPVGTANPWANGYFEKASALELANFLNNERSGVEQLMRWHGAEKVQARLSSEVMWRYLLEGGAAQKITPEKIDALAALLQRAECSDGFTVARLLVVHSEHGKKLEKSALRQLFRQAAAHPFDEDTVRNHARQLPHVLNRMTYERLLETAGIVSTKLEGSLHLISRGLWSNLGIETDKRLAMRINSRSMSLEDIDHVIRHLGHGHRQFSLTLQALSTKALALNGPITVQRLGALAALQMDANVYDKDVFRCIGDELALERGPLPANTRWQILYAFASANVFHPALAPLLHAALREELPKGHHGLGRAIWTISALAACGLKREACLGFFQRATAAIQQLGPMNELTPTRRLYHLAVLLDEPFRPSFMNALKEWEHRIAVHPPHRTFSEAALGRSLAEWGIKFRQGPILFGCTPDFTVTLNGKPWVIECDGASCHFVGGRSENGQRGEDLVRDEIFRKHGYGVLRVAAQRADTNFAELRPLLESLKDGPIPAKTIFYPPLS